MKIAVCGDSLASPSPLSPNNHYSEILAHQFGADLIPLSHGGASNGAICLQIEFAIQSKVDFIIITTTDCDRIEIPNEKSPPIGNSHYKKEKSLRNIKYYKKNSLSTQFLKSDGDLVAENIYGLMRLPEYKTKIQALTFYLDELYDSGWKKQLDLWCMDSVLRRLKQTQIPFTVFVDRLGYVQEYGSWLDSDNTEFIIDIDSYQSIMGTKEDPGFHTGPGAQIEMAHILTPLLRKYLG